MVQKRFLLVDGIAVVFVVAVVLQLLVACGEAVSTDEHRSTNATQIRDIHRGMITYSQMNGGYYPGLSSVTGNRTRFIPATDDSMYGAASPSNNDISGVYAILLTSNLVTPTSIISPLDVGVKESAPMLPTLYTITHANYSYAMLQFGDDSGNAGRREEWRDTSNSKAPVVGDRGKPIDASMQRTGLHANDRSGAAANWQGNIGWNDNHVTFETTGLFESGRVKLGQAENSAEDNLFDVSDGVSVDRNAKFSYR